ncbi:DUF2812 domain-containing protein [Clostridium tagluense]|uniref:DUF2812 domain-containing protein n=1 Tax=Clostridium tagluense TaxID=360422 RepID=UPI001CF4EB7D|nr:DUF2812 domain-containing protein [Clostridium tagluense]MCB2298024.1 DUF2812 domain-containing protein [Clostridium tagluense]
MRSKDTKTTIFMYLPYECSAVEGYLDEMAEKGWLLQSIKGVFFKFKKTEIEKIKYSVDVLNRVSVFDHKDSDVALEYREYCEAAGWTYVCEHVKTQIFYTHGDKEAISIHTDEEEKFKLVFKASLYNMGIQFLLTLLLSFNLYIQLFVGDGGFVLASNMGILSIVTMSSLIIINSGGFISFLIWVIKVRAKLKKDKGMNYSNYKQVRIKSILRNSYGLIILFIFLKLLIFDTTGFNISFLIIITICIPIIIMICVRKFIDKKKHSKNINMGINIGSVVVSIYLVLILGIGSILFSSETLQNDVPTHKFNLATKDFGFVGNNDESPYINFDKSIIAQRVDYSGGNDSNYLSYTMLQSDYSIIIKFYENRLLSKFNRSGANLLEERTKLPNNIVVYSDSVKRTFVVVSQDKVVEIRKDFTNLSEEEFLKKIYEKLFY